MPQERPRSAADPGQTFPSPPAALLRGTSSTSTTARCHFPSLVQTLLLLTTASPPPGTRSSWTFARTLSLSIQWSAAPIVTRRNDRGRPSNASAVIFAHMMFPTPASAARRFPSVIISGSGSTAVIPSKSLPRGRESSPVPAPRSRSLSVPSSENCFRSKLKRICGYGFR